MYLTVFQYLMYTGYGFPFLLHYLTQMVEVLINVGLVVVLCLT